MQNFEGAWAHLQRVHFCEYWNAYELLLKTICNIRSDNSAIVLFIYNAFFMDKK